MKTTFLIVTMLLTFGNITAQISEIKESGSTAFIYNDNGSYTGHSISIGRDRLIAGYNSQHIVVKANNTALIYNAQGSYTGYSISLVGASILNVSGSNILIKKGNSVYYYDFKGNYTGTTTRN